MNQDVQKLNAIIEASKKLTSVLDLDELLKVILEVAVNEIGAERGTVFLVRSKDRQIYSRVLKGGQVEEIVLNFGQGIAGIVAKTKEAIRIQDAYEDSRFNRETDEKTGFKTRNILCLPITKGRKILGVIQLLNSKRPHFEEEDTHFLSALASHMAIAIENAIALRHELEQERTRRELELAAQIQSGLLPKNSPNNPHIELHSLYQPCYSIGGDVYNFFEFGPNRFGVALADVSGKGIPAAMITSALSAYWKALCDGSMDLPGLCFKLNNLMVESIPLAAFATMIFLDIDLDNMSLTYANCGHNPGLLLSGETCHHLNNTGVMLGMFENMSFGVNRFDLEPEDRVLIYTDGLSEASIPAGEDIEEYGLERIETHLKQSTDGARLLRTLTDDVEAFTGRSDHDDDLTAIALWVH